MKSGLPEIKTIFDLCREAGMKPMFIVFFALVLAVMVLGNLYIYRLGKWACTSPQIRRVYMVIFIAVAASYILGRLLQRVLSYDNPVPCALIWIGSFWIAFMLYLALATVAVDLVTVSTKGFSLAGVSVPPIETIRRFGGIAGWVVCICVVASGYFNARYPVLTEIPLTVKEDIGSPVTVVAVTDVHLGLIIGKKELRVLVDRVNALHPDIVIIGGDLFDEDLTPVINGKFGDYLSMFRARYGVYAVTGNHEFFGGADRAVEYMNRHSVRVLRNELADAGPFQLAGRDDRVSERMMGRPRPALADIVAGRDLHKPLIVIDHTPSAIDESVALHSDLHISGHTHHGQLWPMNFVTSAIFPVSRGLVRFGNTAVYVSTGYGTWGPPVRTGNRPEIVKFVISGKSGDGLR